ncbi:hypothetical protein [Lysinibacillus fusiformis]|uniref:hypothetical protein n=1 Tax=Lysinibacillus fusiformis TaxID=28031 RepID=UPI003D05DED9
MTTTYEPIEIPGSPIVAIVRSANEWDLIDPATGEKVGAVVTGAEGEKRYMEIQRWRDGAMTSYHWHPRYGQAPLRELLADAARSAATNP